jgi:hypothetical protein
VSIGHSRPCSLCISTSNTNKTNTRSDTCNSQQLSPSLHVQSVVGTGRYTTSTTNLYHKDFTYLGLPSCARM